MLESLRESIEDILRDDPCGQKPSWENANRIVDEVITTALAEARAEGRRQGLEEAAKGEIVKLAHAWRKARLVACAEPIGNLKVWTDLGAAETALSQALATNAPEKHKPETGESDHAD